MEDIWPFCCRIPSNCLKLRLHTINHSQNQCVTPSNSNNENNNAVKANIYK